MTFTVVTTDVGSMGDRKYAYGTIYHSGLLYGNMTIPMGRVDHIHFTQYLHQGATCEELRVSGTAPPWGTPATPWLTTLPIYQCDSGVAYYSWFAIGKIG